MPKPKDEEEVGEHYVHRLLQQGNTVVHWYFAAIILSLILIGYGSFWISEGEYTGDVHASSLYPNGKGECMSSKDINRMRSEHYRHQYGDKRIEAGLYLAIIIFSAAVLLFKFGQGHNRAALENIRRIQGRQQLC